MIPNGSCWVRLKSIASLGGVHRVHRGSARVCRDPAITARSGIVVVAKAWKVMFDVPEIKIASLVG